MCVPKIIRLPCPSTTPAPTLAQQPDWAPSNSASQNDVWVVDGATPAQGTKSNSQVWVVDAQTANSPMGWW